MRGKIHRQLMRRQRLVVVVVLLGISLFVLWAWSQQLSLPVIIGSSSVLVIGALLVGGYYYRWAWTGLTDYAYPKFEGVEFHQRKTLWDWLQLLIIPIVLAVGGFVFDQAQSDREAVRAEQRAQADRDLAEQHAQTDRDLAAQRAQTDRDIATDNQREAALQAYIDKMAALLLDGQLRASEPDAEIRSVGRTRTLSTLRQLDGPRKGELIQFLHESQLISRTNTIIVLVDADLTGADLTRANLQGVNLERANLQGANLREANLAETNLAGTNLQGAFLQGAFLQEANLPIANLIGANLREANLQGAKLAGANLTGATMPDGSIHP